MENSPLELYETAYRMHYVENKPQEAVGYYESLIRKFPNSNECGYSIIQLQKIKANDIAKALQKQKGKTPFPTVIASMLSIASFVAIVFGLILFGRYTKTTNQYTILITRALGKMYNGEDSDALALLSQAKGLKKQNIVPYELSANIYRRHNKPGLAQKEVTAFVELYPSFAKKHSLQNYTILDVDQTDAVRNTTKNSTASSNNKQQAEQKPSHSPKRKAPPKKPSTNSGGDNLYIVDPDSISFF
jgi:hypothetical protein